MKVHIGPYQKNRKVDIRIDCYDTWDMDSTLSLIIVPMLEQLKRTKHGYPFVDDNDVPEHLRTTGAPLLEEKCDPDNNIFHLRWDWVIDEMIWAFKQNDGNFDYNEDKETRELKNKRMQKGFELFGKYYSCLWD